MCDGFNYGTEFLGRGLSRDDVGNAGLYGEDDLGGSLEVWEINCFREVFDFVFQKFRKCFRKCVI